MRERNLLGFESVVDCAVVVAVDVVVALGIAVLATATAAAAAVCPWSFRGCLHHKGVNGNAGFNVGHHNF